MSNFQCPNCGMTNIDCGKQGYKTSKEIELEKENKEIRKINDANAQNYIRWRNKKEEEIKKLRQKLEKIAEIAQDIIENDCYENPDAKAEKILQIIESEEI